MLDRTKEGEWREFGVYAGPSAAGALLGLLVTDLTRTGGYVTGATKA